MKRYDAALLKVEDLTVTYTGSPKAVRAVDRVSLALRQGECLGLIGESGCGKSSLALAIMGIIKQGSVSGRIMYKGVTLSSLPERDLKKYRWKQIAMVFQNSLEVLNPVLTVGEQVGEPLRSHYGLSAEEAERKVIELFRTVSLDPEWRRGYPHQLSGGMRQKVLLAMALACEPNLLIVDEPVTSLDPATKNEIMSRLKASQNRLGFSLLLISHDLALIRNLTSRILTMYCGQIVEAGPTEEVLAHPAHTYTRGLLNSSPTFFKYKDLWGIGGEPPLPGSVTGCPYALRCCQAERSCRLSRPELKYIAPDHMVACNKGGIETSLKATGIKKTYKLGSKKIEAVKGVGLEIRSGEVVVLVGESGSGKSTLAHILVGVLRGDSGKVFYRGKEVTGRWATKMFGGMQIVFQDPFSSTSHRMRVLDVVKEPLDIIKWNRNSEREEEARKALRKVRLSVSEEFLDRHCYALSGGQRQRVAIARALVTRPRLLIADEITSMLDPSTQANLLRELKGLQNDEGFAMLYITHDLHLARKVADKVYVMHEGRFVESGASFEVFDNPEYDYTRKLMKEAFEDPV